MKPYEERMLEASRTGRILKRADIYGSGPPVDFLSDDAQRLVAKYCSRSIVDFGAGCGALQQYLSPSSKYLGIENNPAAVEMAKNKHRDVLLGDITKSGLADGSFEVCTMFEVLEHVDDYEAALAEAHRVIKSHLVLTVPNIAVLPSMSAYQVVPWHLLEATHVNFFTPESLRKLLLRFFARVKVFEINPWFKDGFHMNIAAIAWKQPASRLAEAIASMTQRSS
jgi:2-polyprenyl-3-methyl-5-hydroxy-6-metoxy-1,4-benzoquinol methylase